MGFLAKLLPKKKEQEIVQITSEEAFNLIKAAKEENTQKDLKQYFASLMTVAESMHRTGQTAGLNRIRFMIQNIPAELELIKRGYDQYVWKNKVDEVLDESEKDLKMIELENFTRVLPEEAVKAIEDTKDLFTNYFIMYTDYTGRDERRIAQENKNKDPILWGCFIKEDDKTRDILFCEKMYPIASWKDEYCDLTLEELCTRYQINHDDEFVEKLTINNMVEDVQKYLAESSVDQDNAKQ